MIQQLIVNGIVAGSIYALIAISFTKFKFMSLRVNEFVSLDVLI
jgi:branched-subunit amino acid ABC-type transport system permease component